MKIEVTQEDIDNGTRCDCLMCPIALATKRTYGPGRYVYVSYGVIAIEDKLFDLPLEALAFIHSFDQYKKVTPFSFELSEYERT